ncbi:N-acetylmuramoyl-L-alanine amidase [Zoogloea sp.]|uniref:N-acetylmuramoyl-L-alanine amidase n=1 Tax=Zoogloea sp. TaxID=49181 RepID=UPI0035B3F917
MNPSARRPVRRIAALVGAVALLAAGMATAAVPVAVDVGHFLAKPGATSAYGVPEFEYNQSLAAVIATRLEADGVPVRLIGYRGEMEDLYARAPQAEAAGAGFLLSVHHDSVKAEFQQPWVWEGRQQMYSEYASGFSLFVSRKNPRLAESLDCASAIGAALRQAGLHPTPHHAEAAGIGRPWADETNGVYYYDNLVVLRTATVPAVLLEAGVIVHPREAAELATPTRRALTADAVAGGLRACGATASP